MGDCRVILVLGMHRSGTSALTRGLQVLGGEVGDNLMPAVAGENEKGFWEDLDFTRFNDRLLHKLGSSWSKLGQLELQRLMSPEFSEERQQAAAMVRGKTENSEVHIFKDPRAALMLSFWKNVFWDEAINCSGIISIRNPLEIVASLAKRNEFDPVRSVHLWAKHLASAVLQSQDIKTVYVNYADLLESPASQLVRIAEMLDLPAPNPRANSFKSFADEFLDISLRHHTISRNELGRSFTGPELYIEFYDSLVAASRFSKTDEAEEQIALAGRVLSHLNTSEPLAGYIDRLNLSIENKKREYERSQTQANEKIAELTSVVKSKKQEIDVLSNSLRSQEQNLARLREYERSQTQANEKIAELTSVVKSKKQEIDVLSNSLRSQEQNLARLEEKLQTVEVAFAKTEEGLTSERDKLLGRLSHTERGLGAAQETITQLRGELEATKVENEGAVAQIQSLREAMQTESERLNETIVAHELQMEKQKLAQTTAERKLSDAYERLSASEADRKRLEDKIVIAIRDADSSFARVEMLETKNKALEYSKNEIVNLVTEREKAIDDLEERFAELECERNNLMKEQAILKGQIEEARCVAGKREHEQGQQIEALQEFLRDANQNLSRINTELAQSQECAIDKTAEVRLLRASITEIRESKSWRLGAPLRAIGTLIARIR